MAKFPLVRTTVDSLDSEEKRENFRNGYEKLLTYLAGKYKSDEEKSLKLYWNHLGNKLLKHFYRDALEDFDSQVMEIGERLANYLGKGGDFDDWDKRENQIVFKLHYEILHKKDNTVKERSFKLESGVREEILKAIPLVRDKHEKVVRTITDKGLVILKTVERVGLHLVPESEVAEANLLVSLNSSKTREIDSSKKFIIERGDLIFSCELTAFRKNGDDNENKQQKISKRDVKKDCSEFGKFMIVSVARNAFDLKPGIFGKVEIRFLEKKDLVTIVAGNKNQAASGNIITDVVDSSSLNPEQEYEKNETLKQLSVIVDEFVNTLSDKEKQIIYHYYVENNSRKDLEEILGESLNTNTIDRAGKKIGKRINGNNNSDMAEFIKNNWKEYIRILEVKLKFDKKL